MCWASSRSPVRTAMSSSVMIPVSRPSSTIGRRRMPWRTMSSAASSTSIPGCAVTTGDELCADAGSPEPRPSVRAPSARSRSVTKPASAPCSSTSTTEPTLRSRMSSATWRTVADGLAVTTLSVITSRISTDATYTCAVAATGDDTLLDERTGEDVVADERARGRQAAAASIAAGVLTMGGGLVAAAVYSHLPSVHVLDAMRERFAAGPPAPGIKARQVLWYDDNAVRLILVAVVLALAAAAIGLALTHLYRSVRARRPQLPRYVVYAAVAGAVLV